MLTAYQARSGTSNDMPASGAGKMCTRVARDAMQVTRQKWGVRLTFGSELQVLSGQSDHIGQEALGSAAGRRPELQER